MRRPALVLHASAFAIDGRAALVLGAAGSGKSSLTLRALCLGAELIADDRTCLGRARGELLAWAPETILGRIEARGVGILPAPVAPPTPVALVVDLDRTEPERLPPARHWAGPGGPVDLIHAKGHPDILWPVLHYLRSGRAA